MSTEHPNIASRLLTNMLNGVCKQTMPRRTTTSRNVPWWDEELTKLRRKANKSKKELCRARRIGLHNIHEYSHKYREARNNYTNRIKKQKKETWRKFVTVEGNKEPWSIVYKIVSGKNNKESGLCSLERNDGTYTKTWKETVNVLLDKSMPKDFPELDTERHTKVLREIRSYRNYNMEEDITTTEIKRAVDRLKAKKTPGYDGFNSEIIKNLWMYKEAVLYCILNNCFRNAVFPNDWKITSVKMILKAGDRDIRKLNSYRPIALTSTLSKVFERIILDRIMAKYREAGLESDRQYGFKPGKSTEDALLHFRYSVENTEKKYVVALFVDIEGAFDNLWWPTIKLRMVRAGCSSLLMNLVNDYFRKRKMFIQSKFDKVERWMQRGCPQGSIIGPIAWNMCMDDLLHKVTEAFSVLDMEVIAYADDLVVLIKGNSRREIEDLGRGLIKILINWCELHKVKPSASKTIAMMVKGRFDRERPPIIKLLDSNIKFCNEFKYLGILIDDKLNFIKHSRHIREKLTKYMMSIRRIAKDTWGIKSNMLKILYKAVAVPITTYGASVWYHKVTHTIIKRNLNAAQRTLLLIIAKACRTTSTSALQILTGNLPLDLEVTNRGLIGQLRRNTTVNWMDYQHQKTNDEEEVNIKNEIAKIGKEIYVEWQRRWTEDQHGRQTYEYIKEASFTCNKKWFNPNRELMYILTGYGPINGTLCKRGAVNTKCCPSCTEEEETVEHILYECNLYTAYRNRLRI